MPIDAVARLNDPIQQIAYFVPDVRQAALAHARLFGSGPYFIADHVELSVCRYRGAAAVLDHSSAYGQWGELMIEFVQQNNDANSVFRDMYPQGGGMHHVALIVENLRTAMTRYETLGFETGLYAEVSSGVAFAMMDCRAAYGHFVELYEPTPMLFGVYEQVRAAARNFDGRDLLRRFAA